MEHSANNEQAPKGGTFRGSLWEVKKRKAHGHTVDSARKQFRKTGHSMTSELSIRHSGERDCQRGPFISAFRLDSKPSRADALGAARKYAFGQDVEAKDTNATESRERESNPRRELFSKQSKAVGEDLSADGRKNGIGRLPTKKQGPTIHEVIRKISGFPRDNIEPCDESYVNAFIRCLETVCAKNEPKRNHAYPKLAKDSSIYDAFPEKIARRYSPDFIRHLLRHISLSRQGLAAALVYLDRGYALAGDCMTVCNENVNTLVLCACVIASRMLSLRGYSDDIIAMISGMKNANELRCSIVFFLDKLSWDARVTRTITRPYEIMLDRFKTSHPVTRQQSYTEIQLSESRNRVLKLYYPPSTSNK